MKEPWQSLGDEEVKKEVGDIITSLSFPALAVPVLGSILIPLQI